MLIDVYHDTVCPWCRIGKRHLDAALAGWDGPPAAVRWRPFFLDETVPVEGVDFRAYFTQRKGVADPEPIFETARRAGAVVGLDFRFDRVRYATNTLRSHRLLALVPEWSQGVVLDGIHRAYFEEGRDIGDVEILADIAAAAGLDGAAVAAQLRGDAAEAAVLDEAAEARELGVTGVPLFVFDGELGLSGAHPGPTLLAAMRAATERRPVAT